MAGIPFVCLSVLNDRLEHTPEAAQHPVTQRDSAPAMPKRERGWAGGREKYKSFIFN
jgi:hypothetical protein